MKPGKHSLPVEPKAPEFSPNSEWDTERILNPGYWSNKPGKAEANCRGGNLLTFYFLMGYEFMRDFGDHLYLKENEIIRLLGDSERSAANLYSEPLK